MRKIITGLIALAGIILIISMLFLQPVMAVTNNTTAATASVTVSDSISVTLSFSSGSGIEFGSLNAGTNNNSGNYLNITIDTTTNVATNFTQNGTTFACTSGGCSVGVDTILIGNLRYSNASGNPGLVNSTVMTTSFPAPPYAEWRNIAKPSTNTVLNSYYWLSIPSNQAGGSYQSSIYINVSKYQ